MEELTEQARELSHDVLPHLLRHVLTLLYEGLEWRPPAVVVPNDVTTLLQSLQLVDQLLPLVEVVLVEPLAVDLRLPAVLWVELRLKVHPLPEIALGREQQDWVEPVDDVGPARDAAGEKPGGDDEDEELVEPVVGDSLVQTGEPGGEVGVREGTAERSVVLGMDQAGNNSVPSSLLPPLVQRQPGREPGELEDVDAGQGDGGADTEGLEPGHLLREKSH